MRQINEPQLLLDQIYPLPPKKNLIGSYCVLQPFNRDTHASLLYKAFSLDKDGIDWVYLPHGPFYSELDFLKWVDKTCLNVDQLFYTVCIGKELEPVGIFCLQKIEPNHGRLELGYVHFSLKLQQTVASTEALYLIIKYIFDDMGYRRLEWKCNNENTRSKRCAERLGFTFEGIFRQHLIVKSRNRDTAWYSIIDKEWFNIKARFESWLNPNNFNKDGQQIKKLSEL